MKKYIIFFFIIFLVIVSFGMTGSKKKPVQTVPDKNELAQIAYANQKVINDSIKKYHRGELLMFLTDIGYRESSNRYDVVNKWGYMGKYQFGRSTLKGLGYDVSKKEFLSNHDLQEEAMMALLNHNKEKLQKYIDIFDGKNVNGIYITESGILAAAHLGGQGSVKRFFKNGRVFRDGNGTKITSYMEKFSGYDIALN